MVISLALLLSLLSGLTQFAHPAVDLWAARNPRRPPVVVNTEIYAMRADGSGQTRLAFNRDGTQAEYIDPAWSPDGRRLAFASGPPGANQLYVMNADGSDRRRLTEGEGNPGRPAWSPDGRLAFQSRRSGNSEIYVLNADGSGFANPTNLTNHPADDLLATWSPDGGRLAFTSNRDGRWQIYAMNADGSGQTRLTHTAAFDVLGAWSPDGQQIAFHSNRDGNWEIYVMNADGSEQTRLTRNDALDYLPAWSPDGRRLAFASNRDGNFEVYVMNADGSEQTNLTNHPAMEDGEIGISWSPDGGTLAFSSRGRPPAEVPLWIRQALGAASVLIQSSLLVGVVLLALRAGPLPFGAFALVFTLNMALISVIHDQYRLIPTAPVAGLAADALARQLQPGAARPDALRLFAFAVPAIYYALYFLTLQVTQGIGWSIHLWLGTVALAGATGVLLTCLLPRSQPLGA
jgi:Tol biopolymer transport system component